MTRLVVSLSFALAAAVGGCTDAERESPTSAIDTGAAPVSAADQSISPEAAALIAEGDAAAKRAASLREEADQIQTRLTASENGVGTADAKGGVVWNGGTHRGTKATAQVPQTPDDRSDLEGRLLGVEDEAELLEQQAIDAWKQAAAMDADAQDAILKRLLGSVPNS